MDNTQRQLELQGIFNQFPTIKTKRLLLRKITNKDLPMLFELFSNPNVTKYYNITTLVEEKEAEEFLRFYQEIFNQKKGIRWGLSLLDEPDKLIGTCGYNFFKMYGRANLGYDLHPDYWSQGLMAEALRKIITFGFNGLQINRVEATVMLDNLASRKLLGKLFFQKEGILRSYGYWKGAYHDLYIYSFLKKEYLELIKCK